MSGITDRNALEAEFNRLMWEDFTYSREHGFKAPKGNRFLQMLRRWKGAETARRPMRNRSLGGLSEAARLGFLDRTPEARMLDERFAAIFTAVEIATARQRYDEQVRLRAALKGQPATTPTNDAGDGSMRESIETRLAAIEELTASRSARISPRAAGHEPQSAMLAAKARPDPRKAALARWMPPRPRFGGSSATARMFPKAATGPGMIRPRRSPRRCCGSIRTRPSASAARAEPLEVDHGDAAPEQGRDRRGVRRSRSEPRMTEETEHRLSLRQADAAQADLYAIHDELEFIKATIARVPTRQDLAQIALVSVLGGAALAVAGIELLASLHR
jgi:hypothetical protein